MSSLDQRLERIEAITKTFNGIVADEELETVMSNFKPGQLEYLQRSFKKFQFVSEHWNQIEPFLPRYKNTRGKEIESAVDISAYSIDDFYELALMVAGIDCS